jgi:hypothetical protein
MVGLCGLAGDSAVAHDGDGWAHVGSVVDWAGGVDRDKAGVSEWSPHVCA